MSVQKDLASTINQLENGDRESRKSAAIKLGRIRDPKSIPFLIKAIRQDIYPMTRVFAIQSLTWIADTTVVMELFDVIRNDQDDLVRKTAIEALVSFKAIEALPVLYEVVHNIQNSNQIKTSASQAIGVIEGYSH